MTPVRWPSRVTAVVGSVTAAVALLSPVTTACRPPATRVLVLVAAAAALGAFVFVATSIGTEAGNGTLRRDWIPRNAWIMGRAIVIAGVVSAAALTVQSLLPQGRVEVGPFALIALSALIGLAYEPVRAGRAREKGAS